MGGNVIQGMKFQGIWQPKLISPFDQYSRKRLGDLEKKRVAPPQNHSKIGGDDDFDVISRKIFRDFSTDFFENKGPPLCFFEKSSKFVQNRIFETFSQNAGSH